MLVIGDVVGHDTEAAAAMGQLRSMLRAIASISHDGPARVLCKVDQAMETLQVGTIATAVVARLEQADSERPRGVTRLRWSNAGHPLPMVIDPEGMVAALTGVHAGLLLGVSADTDRRESAVTLDRGATVVLYTDGSVERRGQSLEAGLVKLQETLEDLAGHDLDNLCDQRLARMLPPRSEDDVALVAARLHLQDRPRPSEAGPPRVPPDAGDSPESVPRPR